MTNILPTNAFTTNSQTLISSEEKNRKCWITVSCTYTNMLPTVFGNRLIRKIYGPKIYKVGNEGFQIMKVFVIYTGYIK